MTNLYILLTGGHSGLGLGVTKKLLQPGNKLGLIIRNKVRQEGVMAEFEDLPKALVDDIDFFFADLSDQQQVYAAAQEIKAKWPRVDRLFNNAAIVGSRQKKSKLGNDMHLEINTLAPVLLTQELKPLLQNSADAKVITTVTGGMSRRKLQIDHFFDDNYKNTMMLYAQSKQAVLLLMNDMADRWQGVKFLAVDPGPNKTKMTQSGETPALIRHVFSRFFNDPKVGTQLIYNAAFDKRFAMANGVYISKDKIVPIKHGMSMQAKEALLRGIRCS